MADNNEALPELPRHEIDWKYGGMTVSRHGDWVRYSDATAALSELRAEMQQLALRSITSEGEWIEMTGELRAEVERANKLAEDRLEQMQLDRKQALVWQHEVERQRYVLSAAGITITVRPEGFFWERRDNAARSGVAE